MVAFLADIFSALNMLNLSLQGTDDMNIFIAEENIEAMWKKLDLSTNRSLQGNFDNFHTLSSFLQSSGYVAKGDSTSNIEQLRALFKIIFQTQTKEKIGLWTHFM